MPLTDMLEDFANLDVIGFLCSLKRQGGGILSNLDALPLLVIPLYMLPYLCQQGKELTSGLLVRLFNDSFLLPKQPHQWPQMRFFRSRQGADTHRLNLGLLVAILQLDHLPAPLQESIRLAAPLIRHLRVDLRVLNRPMAEEILHIPDVYSVRFEAVDGNRMPQAVEREDGVEAGFAGVAFEEFLHARHPQIPLPPRKERISGILPLPQISANRTLDVVIEPAVGGDAVLLAFHIDAAVMEIDVRYQQIRRLADAKPVAIDCQKQGAIPFLVPGDGEKELFELFLSQIFRQYRRLFHMG